MEPHSSLIGDAIDEAVAVVPGDAQTPLSRESTPGLTDGSTVSTSTVNTPTNSQDDAASLLNRSSNSGSTEDSENARRSDIELILSELKGIAREMETKQFINSEDIVAKRDEFLSTVHTMMRKVWQSDRLADHENVEMWATANTATDGASSAEPAIHFIDGRKHIWTPQEVGQAITAIEFDTTVFRVVYGSLGHELRLFIQLTLGGFLRYQLVEDTYFKGLAMQLRLHYYDKIRPALGCDDLATTRFVLSLTMKVFTILGELVTSFIRTSSLSPESKNADSPELVASDEPS